MYKPIPVSIISSKEKQIWSGFSLRPSKLSKFTLPQGKDRTPGTLDRGRSPKRWNLKRKSHKVKTDISVRNDRQTINAVDEQRKIDVIRSYLSSSKSQSTRYLKTKTVMTEIWIAGDPKNSSLIVKKKVIDKIDEMKEKINKLEINQKTMQETLKQYEGMEDEIMVVHETRDNTVSKPVNLIVGKNLTTMMSSMEAKIRTLEINQHNMQETLKNYEEFEEEIMHGTRDNTS